MGMGIYVDEIDLISGPRVLCFRREEGEGRGKEKFFNFFFGFFDFYYSELRGTKSVSGSGSIFSKSRLVHLLNHALTPGPDPFLPLFHPSLHHHHTSARLVVTSLRLDS